MKDANERTLNQFDDIPEQPLYPKHDTCPDCGCTKRRGTDCAVVTCPSNQPTILERFEQLADLCEQRGGLTLERAEKVASVVSLMWETGRDKTLKQTMFERQVGHRWITVVRDDCFGGAVVSVETVNQRTKRQLQAAIDEMERQERTKPAKPQQPAGELEYVALPHVA